MNKNMHERAERLIVAARVEGIDASDRGWLDRHLAECPQCAAVHEATESAIQSLRSVSLEVDPALIRATRLAVHRRARELRERPIRMLPLWIFCTLSWVLGAVSAPYLWRGFEWIGRRVGVPDLMWQTAFLLWWALPAVAVAAILTVKKPQTTE